MTISIFDDMAQCTASEVARLLDVVPQQRRDEALRFKFLFGRFAALKSFEMLMTLLRDEYGVTDFRYARTATGKPYLMDNQDIHFNISHCKNAIAIAVAHQSVGIDVESFHAANDALLRRTMNGREIDAVRHAAAPAATFAALWTQKEASLKLQGTGIVDELGNVLQNNDIQIDTNYCYEKQYVYSVAVFKNFSIKIK